MDNQLESENIALKKRLAALEAELGTYRGGVSGHTTPAPSAKNTNSENKLSLEEYKRYGRQMILPEIGYSGTESFPIH
jgi:adenylyltransferase/sulfurtransferase